MTGSAFLKSAVDARKSPRHIFRRRGFITAGSSNIDIKTFDVSEQGFGVIAAEPVNIGKTCSLIINDVIGEERVQHTFSCETVYCILAGVEGFRIGLHIVDSSYASQKPQLQKIIASCFPSLL